MPDFEVRRLDQYPTEELDELFRSVEFARQYSIKYLRYETKAVQESWLYRIQEALKNKSKETSK